MPGYLVAQGAQVLCLHGGQAQPTTVNVRVRVGGQPVVTQQDLYSIAACPFAPGGIASPCVTGSWLSAASRVKAGGIPVVLQDSRAVCAPNGTGLQVMVTQMRVRGQ